jgi:hypothetical protein
MHVKSAVFTLTKIEVVKSVASSMPQDKCWYSVVIKAYVIRILQLPYQMYLKNVY